MKKTQPEFSYIQDLDHSLPMSLLKAREAVMARFAPILREHGLSSQQWRVLRVLTEESPIDATALARRSLLMMPSLSRILRSMAARSLVQREVDDKDHRRVRISITDEGRKLVDQLTPYNAARYAHIEKLLGKEKLGELYRLLHETIDKLNQHR